MPDLPISESGASLLSPAATAVLRDAGEMAYSRLVVNGGGDSPLAKTLARMTPDQLFAQPVKHPDDAAAALAGLWLWVDDLDACHKIAQDLVSPTGSFWHAIMHPAGGGLFQFEILVPPLSESPRHPAAGSRVLVTGEWLRRGSSCPANHLRRMEPRCPGRPRRRGGPKAIGPQIRSGCQTPAGGMDGTVRVLRPPGGGCGFRRIGRLGQAGKLTDVKWGSLQLPVAGRTEFFVAGKFGPAVGADQQELFFLAIRLSGLNRFPGPQQTIPRPGDWRASVVASTAPSGRSAATSA